MVSLNPIRIMKNNADEEKAEVARLSSFVGAMAIGDLVKSTLGPKGMDKILWGMGSPNGRRKILIIKLFAILYFCQVLLKLPMMEPPSSELLVWTTLLPRSW